MTSPPKPILIVMGTHGHGAVMHVFMAMLPGSAHGDVPGADDSGAETSKRTCWSKTETPRGSWPQS